MLGILLTGTRTLQYLNGTEAEIIQMATAVIAEKEREDYCCCIHADVYLFEDNNARARAYYVYNGAYSVKPEVSKVDGGQQLSFAVPFLSHEFFWEEVSASIQKSGLEIQYCGEALPTEVDAVDTSVRLVTKVQQYLDEGHPDITRVRVSRDEDTGAITRELVNSLDGEDDLSNVYMYIKPHSALLKEIRGQVREALYPLQSDILGWVTKTQQNNDPCVRVFFDGERQEVDSFDSAIEYLNTAVAERGTTETDGYPLVASIEEDRYITPLVYIKAGDIQYANGTKSETKWYTLKDMACAVDNNA